MTFTPTVANCDAYLAGRTGRYELRRVRYRAALAVMLDHALADHDTVLDVGAGWTELDYCLRTDGDWRGRYIPVDGGIDGTDLEDWIPPRPVEWVVALEIIEHLHKPYRLLAALKRSATRGIVVSTPNPATTDVLGMDPTHVTPIDRKILEHLDFRVSELSFYGQPADSLFAVWTPA